LLVFRPHLRMTRPLVEPTPLVPTSGTALHRQLFLVLRDEISRGVYAATGALPKEEVLAKRFAVSRITVRRALADLAALRYVERRHGRGTFVRPDAPVLRSGPSLSVIDDLRATATETDVQVLSVQMEVPPPDIAALLQLDTGEHAGHIVRLRSIDGIPVMLNDAWVPATLSRQVTAEELSQRALYEILMDKGVKFGRMVQEFSAQIADPQRAAWLQTEIGAPLIKLVRLMHDTRSRPVQHLVSLLSPERSRLLMDIPGVNVNTLSTGRIVHDMPALAGSSRQLKV